jgi:hypothetical protein
MFARYAIMVRMTQWANIRDVVLFVSGLAGVMYETVLTSSERPTLLILFAAMLGLPAFLRQPTDPPKEKAVEGKTG